MFDNSVPARKVNFSSAEDFNDKKGKKKIQRRFQNRKHHAGARSYEKSWKNKKY